MTQPLSPRAAERRAIQFSLALFTSFLFIQIDAFPQHQAARTLEPGRPIEEVLAGGQSHSFRIMLNDGQYANLEIGQDGIDVVVKIFSPDGRQIGERDSESRAKGLESVELVAKAMGSFRLEVQAKMKMAAAGRYGVRIKELRSATDRDRALFEADEFYNQATELSRAGKL